MWKNYAKFGTSSPILKGICLDLEVLKLMSTLKLVLKLWCMLFEF